MRPSFLSQVMLLLNPNYWSSGEVLVYSKVGRVCVALQSRNLYIVLKQGESLVFNLVEWITLIGPVDMGWRIEVFKCINSVIPTPHLRILLHPNQGPDSGIADFLGSNSTLLGALES